MLDASGSDMLDLRAFSNLQRVINLDTQLPDNTVDFGVPEQQLDCPEFLRSAVDQGRLGPTQRVRAVVTGI